MNALDWRGADRAFTVAEALEIDRLLDKSASTKDHMWSMIRLLVTLSAEPLREGDVLQWSMDEMDAVTQRLAKHLDRISTCRYLIDRSGIQ